MKKAILFLLIATTLVGCTKSESTLKSESEPKRFITEARCPITPIKDQGKSPSCWIYAMLATIESNRIAMGDSVNLSAAYYERMIIAEQAEAVFMAQGNGNIKGRGMIPHLLTLIDRYGAFTESSYHHRKERGLNFSVLAREVQLMARNATSVGKGLDAFRKDLNSLLDREISFLPKRQFLLGADYSPMEFGHSVAMLGDYEFLGADYAFPDRRETDVIKSMTPDSLLIVTEKSIRAGRAVCWEGDTSEPGYDWANGIADIESTSKSELKSKSKLKSESTSPPRRDIETFQTTDDHCLEICGIAHDDAGRKYFICKNSWGKSNRFKGFIMMSFDYFLAKTIIIGKLQDTK